MLRINCSILIENSICRVLKSVNEKTNTKTDTIDRIKIDAINIGNTSVLVL